ncbi:MAG: lanthionine synthetase C family protein [bacterium]|nr:lanthionine synthetase C family protein [bacterium]
MTKKMKWNTLMNDSEAAAYRKKLDEIAQALLKETEPKATEPKATEPKATEPKATEPMETEPKETEGAQSNPGLMGGKAGFALFFFYYAKFTMEDKYADRGVELLSEIFDSINEGFTFHTHAGGLSGIGWTVEHLAQNGFIDADTNEVLEDLDAYLHKTMLYDIKNENYDFLHGAVGNGTYFLARGADSKAGTCLKELVDQLDEVGHSDDDGARKWLATLDHEKGTKGYNLSLSHGIASIIVFLAKVLETGIYNEKTSQLLNGAVQYLLKYKLDREKFNSNFPSWITKEDPLTPSRLAWCYGDLGIGCALWIAAQSTGNKEWEKIAVDTLLDSTGRRAIKENSVLDVGLCHGSAGIMHIYNRAYHYTGNKTFKETTRYWAEHVLKMATHEDGLAGYKAWHTEKYGGWIAEPAFLEGVSGIGLSLISLLSDIEPKWDHSLYIS